MDNMRARVFGVAVVALVVATMAACAPTTSTAATPRFDAPYAGPRETVALILDARRAWQRDTERAMADAALYELVRHPYASRRFDVVERERLDTILDEIDFNRSGAVDPNTAVRAGRILGAQSMVIMTVTGVTVSRYDLGVLRVGAGGYDVRGTLQMRWIDVETGVIVAVERKEMQQVVPGSFRVPGVRFSGSPQDAALLTAVNDGARDLIDDMMRAVALR